MKKPKSVYGVYQQDEFAWQFFLKEEHATEFRSEESNVFGPIRFKFEAALQQFSNDNIVPPSTLFVSEAEFIQVLNGEDVELSFLSDNYEEEDDEEEAWEGKDRPTPSVAYFKDMREALKWLRSAARFVLTETDFPTDYSEMEEEIRNMGWKIIEYDGMDLLDFVKGLSLVCTVLRPEIFEQTLHELMYGEEN
ncbi:MAG: hypothetical protein ACFFE6_13505 [Candidatus Thorarchaeota archaeon]